MRKLGRKAKPVRRGQYRAVPETGPAGVFLPDKEQIVKLIAMRGASDAEIEAVYGLGSGTVKKWRQFYPGFDKALSEGRTLADADVVFAAYKNAVGFEFTEEQAVGGKSPKVLKVKRFKPGESAAQRYWLNNRQKSIWSNRESLEVSGRDGGPVGLKVETRNDLIEAIVGLVKSKTDPEKSRSTNER